MQEFSYYPNLTVIREAMTNAGFSNYKGLAKALGGKISESTVRLLLTGQHKHTEATYRPLADILDVSDWKTLAIINEPADSEPRFKTRVKVNGQATPEQVEDFFERVRKLFDMPHIAALEIIKV